MRTPGPDRCRFWRVGFAQEWQSNLWSLRKAFRTDAYIRDNRRTSNLQWNVELGTEVSSRIRCVEQFCYRSGSRPALQSHAQSACNQRGGVIGLLNVT